MSNEPTLADAQRMLGAIASGAWASVTVPPPPTPWRTAAVVQSGVQGIGRGERDAVVGGVEDGVGRVDDPHLADGGQRQTGGWEGGRPLRARHLCDGRRAPRPGLTGPTT